MKYHRQLLAILSIAVASAVPLHAQGSAEALAYESDILSARPVRYLIGIGGGASYYTHTGSFSPSCSCSFSDRDGMRAMAAGEFRVQYPKIGIAYGLFVTYYDASTVFAYDEDRRTIVVGDNDDVIVSYHKSSDVKLRWLSFTPEFFWYLPRSEFFLQIGAEFGVSLEARYNNVERILTPGMQYYDGTTERELLAETDIPGGTDLRIAFAGSIGYDFWLTPMIGITPRVGLTLPLTPVSSEDENWTVITGHALLLLNLRL